MVYKQPERHETCTSLPNKQLVAQTAWKRLTEAYRQGRLASKTQPMPARIKYWDRSALALVGAPVWLTSKAKSNLKKNWLASRLVPRLFCSFFPAHEKTVDHVHEVVSCPAHAQACFLTVWKASTMGSPQICVPRYQLSSNSKTPVRGLLSWFDGYGVCGWPEPVNRFLTSRKPDRF